MIVTILASAGQNIALQRAIYCRKETQKKHSRKNFPKCFELYKYYLLLVYSIENNIIIDITQ